jgi:predicted GTPase
MKKIKVALAGNPNSGKTSIFNMLTGARRQFSRRNGGEEAGPLQIRGI